MSSNTFSYCENLKTNNFSCIQEFGIFLAIKKNDFTIVSVSENISFIANLKALDLIGKDLTLFICDKSKEKINKIKSNLEETSVNLNYYVSDISFCFSKNSKTLKECYFYQKDTLIIVEVFNEYNSKENEIITSLVSNFNRSLSLPIYEDDEILAHDICKLVKKITNYDRVYYCHFGEDEHGYVIGEAKNENCDSILHHHFPASDVPFIVRNLYLRNRMRIIPNADYKEVKIIGEIEQFNLDLSLVRTIGKTHIQYIKNMGISSSASFSVTNGNRLAGLIGCHNYTPKEISLYIMNKLSNLIEHISTKIEINTLKKNSIYRDEILKEFINHFVNCSCHLENMDESHFLGLQNAVKFDYIVFGNKNKIILSKQLENIVPETEIKKLINELNKGKIFITNEVRKYNNFFNGIANFSGVMLFNVEDKFGDFIMFVRKEQIETLKWSGNPNDYNESNGQIGPRKSFETWYQEVKNKSEVWNKSDKFYFDKIKSLISEERSKYLSNLEINNQNLQEKNKQIEVLLSEVHHRVKNNLSILNALFDWKIREAKNSEVTSTLKEMKSRVSSISLLHESLYQENNYGVMDLKKYIQNLSIFTKSIYKDTNNLDIKIKIPTNTKIPLQQSLPFGLIVHEFITNSIKYAFKSIEKPLITIEWNESDKNVLFSLSDNGIGCEDLLKDGRKSIGIELIKMLIKQLDGLLEWNGENGVKIDINFSKRKCSWLEMKL
ncbi:histidine kinase dimerization/phosphoacceptor domain -containing protein [Pigmentibacter sp. JX0631]|uniref:histidine kinase dimerization/phosphoacceptor domain -containing protein n=1 Tax=Pigmentibacter sp. JX0631 TaxID=2976982 RepID=UPI0024682F77|nr:histidine kinase dimerization/phosphoacceptor domain -containing protein [Pigmentibacter sp. JX0631]WGL58894.1 histidine kinase dimerization/phosphoacceptor domain -containing protein [Pigmentibacter sp. JX0631]